jgi:hypothetical protein
MFSEVARLTPIRMDIFAKAKWGMFHIFRIASHAHFFFTPIANTFQPRDWGIDPCFGEICVKERGNLILSHLSSDAKWLRLFALSVGCQF